MAELIVETGPRAGLRIPLNREEPCTIGSSREATLRLEGDAIAKEHCVVKALKDAGFGIKALGGEIVVDGQPVQATRLATEAKIELGGVRLRFSTRERAAGPEPEPPAAAPSTTTLGGYRLIEVLGKGGWGTVYRAEQVSLHRELALKVLNKELTKDPVFVARFVAEARAAARLSHPNVVQVFDVGHVEDTYFYSMEIMQGGSLERRLKQSGKLPVEEGLAMLADAARGLAFAESMRIVHRDIKPDNLMVDQHGTVKIVDLGLAMSDEDEQTKIAGTPHFMSPEQVQRKPLDHRSDLYSLGCTFYRLLTGKTPFTGATSKEILKAQVTQTPDPACKAAPELPSAVGAILDKLLQKNPDDRFGSANDLIAAIEGVLAPPARKGLIFGGIAAALVIAGGSIWYAVTHRGETKVVEKTITETDPEGQRAKREVAAGDARDVLTQKGLRGMALADALDELVKAHPDTKTATRSAEESKRIRTEVAEQTQKEAQKNARVQDALAGLEKSVQEARGTGDLAALAKALELGTVAEELRADPRLAEFVARERRALTEGATKTLEGLLAAVASARQAKDATALATAIAALEGVLEGPKAWPDLLLPERSAQRTLVALAKSDLAKLQVGAAQAAEAAAWGIYVSGVKGTCEALGRFAFDEARTTLAKLTTDLAGKPQLARVHCLSLALEAAARFHARWLAEVQQGKVTLIVEGGETATVTGFAGPEAAAALLATLPTKPKPKVLTIPRAELKEVRLLELFAIPGDQGPAAERVAFLALLALGDHLREAKQYLARLKVDDDASGTGGAGYPFGAVLPTEIARLAAALPKEEWLDALRSEMEATTTLALGLRALSERRNLTAASWLERVHGRHADSLVARSLQ